MRSLVKELASRSCSSSRESWTQRVSILGLADNSDEDGHSCMKGTPAEREGYAGEFMFSLAKGLVHTLNGRDEWSDGFLQVVHAGSQMCALPREQGVAIFLETFASAAQAAADRTALIKGLVAPTKNAANCLKTLFSLAEEHGLRMVPVIEKLHAGILGQAETGEKFTGAGGQEFDALMNEALMRARIHESSEATPAASAATRMRRASV